MKDLCVELKSLTMVVRGGFRAEGALARGLREEESGQPCRPSLPPVPSLGWSSFQAARSPAPARQTTLTLSVTPALGWSTSRPATQAAGTGWSTRLRTKARWVRPLAAPSASHGLCPSHLCAPAPLPALNGLTLAHLSVCVICLLLLADVELYSFNKLSLPAWAQPCARAQSTEVNQIWPRLSMQGRGRRK